MIHKNSQETKDFITNFVAPDFFFSKSDVWHRMGMLGVFGDYVLSCTQGSIAEVGAGESSIYLSYLARKWNRHIHHCDIAPDKILNPLTVDGYLTVHGEDRREGRVHVENEIFVKENSTFFIGPSDNFFLNINEPLALTFIDGDHNFAQAKKDFINAIVRTVDNGYVLLHDTYPPSEEYLHEARCGDVYKLRQWIESMPELDSMTLPVGAAMGVGLTIVRKKPAHRAEWQK